MQWKEAMEGGKPIKDTMSFYIVCVNPPAFLLSFVSISIIVLSSPLLWSEAILAIPVAQAVPTGIIVATLAPPTDISRTKNLVHFCQVMLPMNLYCLTKIIIEYKKI